MTDTTYDLAIIGAGPAGMTAAVFAARKGLKTVIVSKDIGGQVNWTTDIENYMGFQEIDGQKLVERFEEQVKDLHLDEKLAEIASLGQHQDGFSIKTKNEEEIKARAVIVSSGKKPRTLNVPGEVEFRNKGVSYCSTCDGPLFRNLPVAVVGGGNSAVKSVLDLDNYASEIHLIAAEGLTADAILAERLSKLGKVKQYLNHTVIGIQGGKSVSKATVQDLKSKNQFDLPVQGVFIEIGLETNIGFVAADVAKSDRNEIQVDCNCQTNISGLFAAGDVTTVPEKQIIVAAGEGAKAALQAWEYLMHQKQAEYQH